MSPAFRKPTKMKLLLSNKPSLIGINRTDAIDIYACTLEEFLQQWRKSFGRQCVTACTTEFRPGGSIYEGMDNISLVTSETEEPRYKAGGSIDGRPYCFDATKMQWFQVGYCVYYRAVEEQWTNVGGTMYFKG